MNTISNNQNNMEVYLEKRIQAAKALQQYKVGQQKSQEENDFISISQQGLQALGNCTPSSAGSPLDSLVEAGTITQDQANAVQSVFQSRGREIQTSGTYSNKTTKSQNPLERLITAGTITQDQADSIKSALDSARKASKSSIDASGVSTKTNPLDSLVSVGTITQDQETAVESTLQEAMKANGSRHNQRIDTDKNPLSSLISAGTITQNRA